MVPTADPIVQECERCGRKALYDIEPSCRACNHPIAARSPNVTFAGRFALEIENRYRIACDSLERGGARPALDRFQAVAGRTTAVVNLEIDWACAFFNDARLLYTTYGRLVEAGARAPASSDHDRQRRGVDGVMYGSYADSIAYAALSGDGRGLTSYGPIHVELDETTVGFRSTVLEENSFKFVQGRRIVAGDPLPPGCLAIWEDRHKLAVIKHQDRIHEVAGDAEGCRLLLVSTDDRRTDVFLEVHVYGTFNYQAVKSVKLGLPPAAQEFSELKRAAVDLRLQELQETLTELGIAWRWA